MAHEYALLRLAASFHRHVLKAATSLPPVARQAYFADAARTLEVLRVEMAAITAGPQLRPPAERP